jgi:hypothetical protein
MPTKVIARKTSTRKPTAADSILTSTAPVTRRGPGRPARTEAAEKLAAWLPADLLMEFRLYCTKNRLTMSEVVSDLVRDYMKGKA